MAKIEIDTFPCSKNDYEELKKYLNNHAWQFEEIPYVEHVSDMHKIEVFCYVHSHEGNEDTKVLTQYLQEEHWKFERFK